MEMATKRSVSNWPMQMAGEHPAAAQSTISLPPPSHQQIPHPHPNSHSNSDSDPNSYPHPNSHSNSDSDPNSYPHPNSHSNSDSDPNSYPHPNSFSHPLPHAHQNPHPQATNKYPTRTPTPAPNSLISNLAVYDSNNAAAGLLCLTSNPAISSMVTGHTPGMLFLL